MIKGVNKNVIIIRNLKNDIFEEAIFILKPQKRKPKKSAVLKEVRKIIETESDIFISGKKLNNLKKL